MTSLVALIAANHRLQLHEVRALVGRRPPGVDIAVLLSFGLLFGFASWMIARWIDGWLPFDAPVTGLVIIAVTAVITSIGGVMMFELWSQTLEILRIGNQHMSYRVGRLPWSHHTTALFVGAVVTFSAIVVVRYRLTSR
jgi:hypothetical protein